MVHPERPTAVELHHPQPITAHPPTPPLLQVQPGRSLEAAWQAVRDAAAEAGRDADDVGLEGNVWVAPAQLPRAPDRVARWRDVGAEAIALNTLRAGARWPDEHLDALLRAAEIAR